LESPILGHLPGFSSVTKEAFVTGAEAATVLATVARGLHNFRVQNPNYYTRWMSPSEAQQVRLYRENISARELEGSVAEAA
jgi:hypothetical protein